MSELLIGDITLKTLSEQHEAAIRQAAAKYDDAMRKYGLVCRSTDPSVRNLAAGEVYRARKHFIEQMEAEEHP